ncbi:MAG: hypothetical protein ACTHN5_21320 [Phycisphaerae bacterium]
MSRNDQLFCAQLATITHTKKLPSWRKERIRSIVRAITVGTVARVFPPKMK